MDDALVERWKQGEGAAATAVRNALRTTAERVLSNPALRAAEGTGGRILVDNEERRRELTATIAKEVMSRGGDSAATLNALTLMSSARHAVEAMRSGRPMAGSAHLPPPIAVALALTPEALPAAQREAYQRHIESCSSCAEDCRLVREIVRSAAAVQPDTSPVALEEAVHEHAEDAMAAAAQAAVEEMERRETRTGSTRTEPGRNEARRAAGGSAPRQPFRPAPRPPPAEPSSGGWLRALIPLFVLGGAGLWWWSSQRADALNKTVDPAISGLADRSPPPVGAAEEVPEYAQSGVTLLGKGDCRTAGARFRAARRAHPEDRRLWVLEGGSFVCAGDGASALMSLEVLAQDPEATPAARWFYAQAQLLSGNVGQALTALEAVAGSQSPYAEKAKAQLAQVQALAP